MVKKFPDFFFSFSIFFTAAGLCFGLKNFVVLKSPNSEPESIYLATRHRCVSIDLVGLICLCCCLCSPRVRYSRVLQTRVCPVL
jgi:hypothetical protein